MKSIITNKGKLNPFNLSKKEVEILNLVASGFTSKEIANMLGRSLRTIEVHRHNLRKKTKSSNSIELVRKILKF